ncbi:ankyrin repeat-containing protein ITN1-like [Mangifera indica]|uniref:ankyrin repeat-containing protein ITN1-like n=1 Tax=Mangifera indica TaxID=29780 RepID=UPI001CF9E9E6|nr:ankyrin repeat-containing protein ITN1-like [Mangifera indica]
MGQRGSIEAAGPPDADPLDDSQIEAQPPSSESEAEAAALPPQNTTLPYSYRRLYHAAKNGDWKTAESFVRDNSDFVASLVGDNTNLWLARLTSVTAETALMVTARSFQWEFVEKPVELLNPEELAMRNSVGYTVLHFVAYSESVKTAEILVRKCRDLTQMVSTDEATPLLQAARRSLHKDMIWYLALVTRLELGSADCPFTGNLSNELFRNLTYAGFHVPGLKQVREAKLQHRCVEKMTEKFCIELGLNCAFDRVVSMLELVIFLATIFGHVEIVRICLKHCPDLIFKCDGQRQHILHVATEWRQEEIFNLITEIPATTANLLNTKDAEGNSIRHIAAKLARPSKLLSISGAALQMQREVQWLKEVEKLFDPAKRGEIDMEVNTVMDYFTENHKKLAEEGEKWMKDTANSCMIVTTLVATVVFAAAFTIPGGNVGDTGNPVFLQRTDFLVLVISDALALLSSSTSLLMFFSILTARYALEDFLLKLPMRLIIGLGCLFFAIITMMVAFGAALYMQLKDRWVSIYIPIIVLGCIPVLLFAKQQVPLFYDMVQSTYGFGVFRRKKTW